jgi:NAD(P)-dependent dehydrogenase (short-subunit alcohol dehydrogenase family)
MPGSCEDRVVVICGGSAGVGRDTARRFASEGARTVLLARRRERLDAVVAELDGNADGIVADIGDPASVRAAFDQIARQFGRVDTLVNVAGAARVRRIEEASDEDIQAVVGTNFLGPIYTTRAAIPLLRAAGGGDVVNISSEVTLDDMPLMTLYSASKRALNAFTRSMTKELRGDGIRVTLLVLGSVGGTSFEENMTAADFERALPVWQEDGYLTRVAGAHRPMEVGWVSDAIVYVVTRPRGMMLDVVHVRVFA